MRWYRRLLDQHAARCTAAVLCVVTVFAGTAMAASRQDNEALELARRWQQGDATVVQGPDGRVLFAYGQAQPRVVCAVFRLCDIALEPGEIVEAVNIGDATRWNVEQARTGSGAMLVEHLIIKPTAPELKTSLFIGTDRRSYLLELVSSTDESMGMVGFLYGDSPLGRALGVQASGTTGLAVLPRPAAPLEPAPVIVAPAPVGREVIAGNLNFDYRIAGDRVPWRPVRVYDDGQSTYIDFDAASVNSTELRVLLVNDTDARGAMINYRYDTRGRIIVDGLFRSASLLLGKGRAAAKVTLHRDSAGAGELRP